MAAHFSIGILAHFSISIYNNEYALGYIMPEQPDKVCTLVDRITLGAPFRTMNEPYFIGKRDTVRLAGRKDFDTFRVVFDGYDNPQEYEFDTAQ